MDDYQCPKCKLKAVSVKYRERRSKNTVSKWVMEYRCPGGHKWTRLMGRPAGRDRSRKPARNQ